MNFYLDLINVSDKAILNTLLHGCRHMPTVHALFFSGTELIGF
jgi:hypothetical protein